MQALGAPHKYVHIRLMLDNTTAINKMGGGGGGYTQWFVTLSPKPYGNGTSRGKSG